MSGLPVILAVIGALAVIGCGVLVARASHRPWPVTVYRDEGGPLLRGSLERTAEIPAPVSSTYVITDLPAGRAGAKPAPGRGSTPYR